MLNNASLFLGLRYLQPKRSFVSIITIISVMGITLGVAVLIVVISVMKGFEQDFKQLLIGFEPHVLVVQDTPIEGLEQGENSRWQKVLPELKKLPGVTSAAPFAAGMVFLEHNSEPTGVEVYGLPDSGAESMVAKLSKHLVPSEKGEPEGSLDMEGDNIVINDQVAGQLGIRIGDKVTVWATSNMQQLVAKVREAGEGKSEKEKAEAFDQVGKLILPQDLTVVGILRSDATWGRCYLPLHIAQELFSLKGRVHGIGIELKDAHAARSFAQQLIDSGSLPPDWGTNTWMDRHGSRLAAIQNERVMMWFVLSFVILVAAFSVATTTLTVTVQKRREIGILTALGARVSQIVGVFMTQASVVALLGTVLGYISGTIFLHYRNAIRDGLSTYFNVQIFPKDIYFLAEIPAYTQTQDVVIICSVSVVLCLLAAFLPAFFAARVDPAVALRD